MPTLRYFDFKVADDETIEFYALISYYGTLPKLVISVGK